MYRRSACPQSPTRDCRRPDPRKVSAWLLCSSGQALRPGRPPPGPNDCRPVPKNSGQREAGFGNGRTGPPRCRHQAPTCSGTTAAAAGPDASSSCTRISLPTTRLSSFGRIARTGCPFPLSIEHDRTSTLISRRTRINAPLFMSGVAISRSTCLACGATGRSPALPPAPESTPARAISCPA